MSAVSPLVGLMIVLSAAAQIGGILLLPATRGFTQPLPTIGVAVAYLTGVCLMARVSHAGINLSLFIPILAALIPMGSIALGMVFYGESASFAKIGMLVTACVMIGVANAL